MSHFNRFLSICVPCFLAVLSLSSAFIVRSPSVNCNEIEGRPSSLLSLQHDKPLSVLFSSVSETSDLQEVHPPVILKSQLAGTVALVIPSDQEAVKECSLFGSKSPVGCTSVANAAKQLSRKIEWFSDGLIQVKLFTADDDIGKYVLF